MTANSDAHTRSNEPSANFGSEPIVRVQKWAGLTGFANFDLTGVSVPVDQAYLRLNANTVKKPGGILVYEVQSPWSEQSITHNSRPSLAGTPAISTTVPASAEGAVVSIDVTVLVNAWIANPASNFGLALVQDGANIWIDSRESGFPMSIETINLVPSPAPDNTFPTDGAIATSVYPTLETSCSEASIDAAQYQIATNLQFTEIVYDSGEHELDICGHRTLDSLNDVSTYYWRARRKSGGGLWSAWSSATAFTTGSSVGIADRTFRDGTYGYSGTSDTDIRGSGLNPQIAIRNWNQGAQDVIRTGRRPPGSATDEIYRALLRFDVSELTDPGAIISARIALTGWQHGDESHNVDVVGANQMFRLLRAWGEGSTIAAAPATGESSWTFSENPLSWSSPGADNASDNDADADRMATALLRRKARNRIGEKSLWSGQALTQLVRDWVANPAENFGLLIKAENESVRSVYNFASKENADQSFRPQLIIETSELGTPPPNSAPVSNAGTDFAATVGSSAQLNGAVLDDGLPIPPGEISISWFIVSAPGSVDFDDISSPETAVTFGAEGSYTLRLIADDGELQDSDDVMVSVTSTPLAARYTTVADTFTRNGDPDGNFGLEDIVRVQKYQSQTGYARFDLSTFPAQSTTSADLILYASDVLKAGELTVHRVLGAWDEQTLTAGNRPALTSATVTVPVSTAQSGQQITVDVTSIFNELLADPANDFGIALATSNANIRIGSRESGNGMELIAAPGGVIVNAPPSINAGPDQAVLLPAPASLSGVATDDGLPDPPGSLALYWSVQDGPGPVVFSDQNSLISTASFSVPGAYQLELTGYDGELQGRDIVRVDVSDAGANQAPLVNAGQDFAVAPEVTAILAGSVSDDGLPSPPGTTVVFWSVVSGPGTGAFSDSTNISTQVTFDTPGVYVLRLTADDSELQSSDDIVIDVTDPGASQSIPVQEDSYTRKNQPDTNFGSSPVIRVQKWADMTGYFRFDLSTIPAGATASAAIFEITIDSVRADGNLSVHKVLGDWSESTLTYENRPSLGPALSGFSVTTADSGRTLQLDVTAITNSLLADPLSDYGFAIAPNDVNAWFDSRETGAITRLLIYPGPPPAISFTDITEESRISGPAWNGNHGIAITDADDSGLADIYITVNDSSVGSLPDTYYSNLGGNVFSEEATQRGIDNLDAGSHGSVFADFDNDGDYDLFNGSYDQNRLYTNDGNGSFTDSTSAALLPSRYWPTRGVAAFDFDLDGDLDIAGINGYLGSGDPAGERNEFYVNTGNGQFVTLDTEPMFSAPAGQGLTDTDYDNDGDVDLFAANRNGDLIVLRNVAGTGFELVAPSNIGISHMASDGITFGDVNTDGHLDVLLGAELYLSDGDATFSHSASLDTTSTPYMGGFADLDLDGDLDIVFPGANYIYENSGNGQFSAARFFSITSIDDPRAVAFADFDNDGDVDLVYTQNQSGNKLIRNNYSGPNNWLQISLKRSNGQAGAFGARIFAYAAGMLDDQASLITWREVRSQDGYLSQSDPRISLGLGDVTRVDIRAVFPGGSSVVLTDVSTMQRIDIQEDGP